MAEETQNARKSAPRGILACCVIGSLSGLVYILGLLFAIPNDDVTSVFTPVDAPADNCTALSTPMVNSSLLNCTSNVTADAPTASGDYTELNNLFLLSLGSTGGYALTVIIAINVFLAGVSSVTVTSRIAFALARDGALPGSKFLYEVNEYTMSPIRVVVLIYLFDMILLLLQLGSSAAFTAIVSLTTIGFQISYAIPLWLRVTQSRNTFKQGAFHLGPFSYACSLISSIWLTFTSLLFFWPFSYPVDVDSMNYTVVVVGSVFITAMLYWLISARHWFKGPKRGKNEPQRVAKGKGKGKDKVGDGDGDGDGNGNGNGNGDDDGDGVAVGDGNGDGDGGKY